MDENKQKDNYEIPNCYLFDDEIMNNYENNSIKLILFQNYLKFFTFYCLSKKKTKKQSKRRNMERKK